MKGKRHLLRGANRTRATSLSQAGGKLWFVQNSIVSLPAKTDSDSRALRRWEESVAVSLDSRFGLQSHVRLALGPRPSCTGEGTILNQAIHLIGQFGCLTELSMRGVCR